MRNARTILIALALAAGLTGLGAFALSSSAQEAVVAADAQGIFKQDEASAWIGIGIANLNQKLADKLGITTTSGVVITNVAEGGPAHGAQLSRGDVITAVNGTAVASVADLKTALKGLKAGDTVTLSITNSSGSKSVPVTAEARPQNARGPKIGVPGHFALPFLGTVGGIIPELKDIPKGEFFQHYLGSQQRFKDKDGNVITVDVNPGTIASADASSINLNLNAGGQQLFSLNSEVKFMPKSVTADSIEDGTKVVVVSVNGEVRAVMALVEKALGDGERKDQRNGKIRERIIEAVPFESRQLGAIMDGWLERGELNRVGPGASEIESIFKDLKLKMGGAGDAGSL